MAIVIPVQQIPSEKISDFNKRLQAACLQEDNDGEPVVITDATMHVVDGFPLVMLSAEMVEATEEDVENDAPAAGEEALKLGELIPAGPGLIVQVTKLGADTDKAAEQTQGWLDKLVLRFGGEVLNTSASTGTVIALVGITDTEAGAGKPVVKQVPVRKDVTYLMLAYDAASWEQGEQTEAELKNKISGKR